MTLVATAPNLVVTANSSVTAVAGFRFFSFTPFWLRQFSLSPSLHDRCAPLVDRAEGRTGIQGRPSLANWIDQYRLADREYRLRVRISRRWSARRWADLNLRQTSGANIVALERNYKFSREMLRPIAKMELQAGDVLLIDLSKPGEQN